MSASSVLLQHKYVVGGKELGSLGVSVFVSDDGSPHGEWKAHLIHNSTNVSDGKHTKLAGYVESIHGKHFAILLTWRNKSGALTKSWKNGEDLYAFYYLDARPHPVMQYSILQPGARSPLPLSGLWKSDTERCPLRWESRSSAEFTPYPDPSIYVPAANDNNYPFLHALATPDDLSSIRITIHSKDVEEELFKKRTSPPITKNKFPSGVDNARFAHARLSDHIVLSDDGNTNPKILHSLINTTNDLPRSVPFVEIRIYYKSRAVLEKLNLLPTLRNGERVSNPLLPNSLPPTPVSRASATLSDPLISTQAIPSNENYATVLVENPGQTALNDVRTPTPGPVLPVELVRTTPSKRSPLSQHVSSSLHVADASAHTENTRSAQRIKVEQHDGNTEVQADEPSDSSQRTGPDSHLYLDCIDPVHSPSAPSAVSTASYAPSPTAGRPMAAASPHTTASTAMQSFPPSSPLVKEERRSSLPFSQQESQAGTSCSRKDRQREAAYSFLQEVGLAEEDDPEEAEDNIAALLS
ncbi:MAG: hypothetical protein CYPHOPRED_004770, partial [Cyphobasidiales sp. Tagirdzhanova-0007]